MRHASIFSRKMQGTFKYFKTTILDKKENYKGTK